MPEQFTFDQVAGNGCHIDRHEWTILAAGKIMQGAGNQLFTGARFATNQHGQVRSCQARNHAIDILHRRRPPDQGHRLFF